MPAVAVTIGQTINNYRVVRQIGEGGMGAVFEVAHIHIGQRAALKAMTVDLKTHPGLFQRFVNEARAVGQIDHPCVVKVIDFGQFPDGSPWMIMEYLKGQTLSARLSNKCLGAAGLWIIADLASALAATHAAGIVHRDLKPGNVMLVPDPVLATGERAKLLDFGVAKLCDDSLTKSGALLGTPMYMAPEQIKNSADVNGQADVYALGVILYQMLSGRLPYEARETFALLAAKSFYPPTPIAQHVPALPSELQALTMSMLAHEPTQRPTMVEIELAVRRALGMPPPRPSGWHNVIAETQVPVPPPVSPPEEQLSSIAITADAPAAGADPAPATPSGEKAAGEFSPRGGIVVPVSLSSMPSVLAAAAPAAPRLPETRRLGAQPALAPRAAVDRSSDHTTPAVRRRPLYWFFGAALALSAVGTWAIVRPRPAVKPSPVARPATSVPVGAPTEALDLAAPPDLALPADPIAKPLPAHPRRERDHGKAGHSLAKGTESDELPAAFEVSISGANAQQERLIRACCVKELKSLKGVPHAYRVVLQRSGSLHITEAPEAVRLTDLPLCLRQAFFQVDAPEAVTVHVRGSR